MRRIVCTFILTLLVAQMSFATNKEPLLTKLPENIYSIQLMASSNPQVSQFQAVKDLGYIFTEQAGKFQRVFMGRYEDKAQAEKVLGAVKALGFPDAFLSTKKVNTEDMTYTVQIQSYISGQPVEWKKWSEEFDEIYVYLAPDNKVKLMVGQFNDIKSVNEQLQVARAKGAKGAYIKHVNKALIHKASPFEIAISNDIAYSGSGIKGELYLPNPTEVPVSYDEYNKQSRESVKELQQLLSKNSNYNGQIDGVYGVNTSDAMNMFEIKNTRYLAYKEVAKNMEDPGVKAVGLQYYVNQVYDNPLLAYGGLKEVTHPMSDVYLAYMYFTGKANPKDEDKQVIVNRLMNGAVKKVFVNGDYKGTTELDFNQTYNYDNILLIIKHLSYMQDAMQDPPSLPCWMFENHRTEAASIFNSLYSMVSGCGDFMEWEELKVLKTIAADLDPVDHSLNPNDEDVKMAYDARRAQLYLAPTVSEDEASVMDAWHKRFWNGMNTWKNSDPLHKKMVLPLEMAYYKALVKLENHYLGRGFTEDEARVLGLSVMRTVVNYHLETYVK